MPRDDDRERGENEPLGQHRRGGRAGQRGAEGVLDPPDEPAGDEHGPALDIDGADECRQNDRGQHEPSGARAENGGH